MTGSMNTLTGSAQSAVGALASVKRWWDSLTSGKKTLTVEHLNTYTTLSVPSAINNNPPYAISNSVPNINKNTRGAGHALGGIIKQNGSNLVGELGRELIVDPYRHEWYTVGEHGAEFVNLPKDAIIFPHNKTEQLLQNGKINGRGNATGKSFVNGTDLTRELHTEILYDAYNGKSYASGNAYEAGSLNYSKSNTFSGGGSITGLQHAKEAAKAASKAKKSTKDIAKNSADAAKSANKAKDATEKTESAIEKIVNQTKNVKNWIDTMVDRQTKLVELSEDEANKESNTYQSRLSSLQSAIEYRKNELNDTLSKATMRRSQEAMEAVDRLQKALKTAGASDEQISNLVDRVKNGNVEAETFRDNIGQMFSSLEDSDVSSIMTAFSDVESAMKNADEALNKYKDNQEKILEDTQKEYELQLNKIKGDLEDINNSMNEAQDSLDLKSTLGELVVPSDYQDMIDLADEQIDNYKEQLDVLNEQLDSLDEGSEEWYNVKKNIADCSASIRDCEKKQAEWNEEIKRLPIKRIESYIAMLENIKKDLSNYEDVQSAVGISTTAETIKQQYEIITKQIDKYNEKQQKLQKLLKDYDYGSDKFEETSKDIQECEDNVSDLIKEMEELNKTLLQMPIDQIKNINDAIDDLTSALQKNLDEYESTLSAVLALFEKQNNDYTKEKEKKDKYYEDLIKPLQDQLDLLNEQNEALSIRNKLEQAEFDLQKAQQQKNVQVVRHGRIEYDSDYDAIRNAQDNLNDAKTAKIKYDIQQQIDDYNKLKDKADEYYDEIIKKISDAKNKWEEFKTNLQFDKDSVYALNLFGQSWEDKIKSYNDDDLYKLFSDGYKRLDTEIDQNNDIKNQNEIMTSFMEGYNTEFLKGNMSADEVRSQYNQLLNDMRSGGKLTAQEYLDAELRLNKATTPEQALGNDNTKANESYNKYFDYLNIAESNMKTIDKYTQTWDQISKSIQEQLAELKRLADEAERIAGDVHTSVSRSSSHESDSKGGEVSRNPTGYGAHTKYNHTDHTVYGAPAYADGIKNGPVRANSDDKFKILQKMALTKIDPDEYPAFLHLGEGVLNPGQISTLISNMQTLGNSAHAVTVPVNNANRNSNINIEMPVEFNLPNVENSDEFMNSVAQNFEPVMNQMFSKVFNQ